ncbi:hypothetical protein NMY22_g10128 [Coprinellus aureogranulatus]|nr:hypothetical protein NMY22_g10128 [Coprinellus aureogranulatus]
MSKGTAVNVAEPQSNCAITLESSDAPPKLPFPLAHDQSSSQREAINPPVGALDIAQNCAGERCMHDLGSDAKLTVSGDDVDAESQGHGGSEGGSTDGEDSDDEREGNDDDLQKLGSSLSSSCRVTFRPRVRIASGISRHRHSGEQPRPVDAETPYLDVLSASSSRSCSPSSSISAPLRFHSEEAMSKPGWGTLGQRVSLLARRSEHKRRFRDHMKRHERMLKSFQGVQRMHHSSLRRPSYSDETRPLLDPRTSQYICQCGIVGCEYDERRIAQEIDILFGTWPIRMLNPKWWWWHIQPIVFCRWLDDPDDVY